MGAVLEMRSRIVWRLSARKISSDMRFVMIRVLEGGVGCSSGGILERSSVSDVFLDNRPVDARGLVSCSIAIEFGGV